MKMEGGLIDERSEVFEVWLDTMVNYNFECFFPIKPPFTTS